MNSERVGTLRAASGENTLGYNLTKITLNLWDWRDLSE